MKKMQNFLMLAAALNFAPLTALAQERAPELHYLTLEEAKATFEDFEVAKVGKDPESRAQVFGMIYGGPGEAGGCAQHFQFESRADKESGQMVLSIADIDGKGVACQAEKRKQNASCTNSTCQRLSSLPATSIDLKDAARQLKQDQELSVGWYSEKGLDRKKTLVEPLDITYKSALALKRENDERIAKAREERIALYQRQVARCKTKDPLAAMEALTKLCAMGACKDGEFDKMRNEISLGQLTLIAKKAKSLPATELETVREELASWAAENPLLVARAATVYSDIAKRYVAEKAFPQAEETLKEALALEGIEDAESKELLAAKKALQAQVKDLQTEKVASVCDSHGWQMNWACQSQFAQLVQKRQAEAWEAFRESNGTCSTDSCAQATLALQSTMKVREIGMQADFRIARQRHEQCLQAEQFQRMMSSGSSAQTMQAQVSMCGPAPQQAANGLGIGGAAGVNLVPQMGVMNQNPNPVMPYQMQGMQDPRMTGGPRGGFEPQQQPMQQRGQPFAQNGFNTNPGMMGSPYARGGVNSPIF